MLLELGAVPHWTKVVAVCDDAQLFDELPERLFAAHDMPVDLIVTPTRVVRVARPPKRPTGVDWRLVSTERLRGEAVLCALMARAFLRHGVDPAEVRAPEEEEAATTTVGGVLKRALGARASAGRKQQLALSIESTKKQQQPKQPPMSPPPLKPHKRAATAEGAVVAAATTTPAVESPAAAPALQTMADLLRDLLAIEATAAPVATTTTGTKRVKPIEGCHSYTFSGLPGCMTRHLLQQTITVQLSTMRPRCKPHYIRISSECIGGGFCV